MSKRKLDICDSIELSKQQKVCKLELSEIDLQPIYDEYVKHNYRSIRQHGIQHDEIINKIKYDITLIIGVSNDMNKGTRDIDLQEAINALVNNKFDLVNAIMDLVI